MVKRLIIDTDIGGDIDDAYALVFALKSAEFRIQAVLTNTGDEEKRAKIAHKLIKIANKNIPVFVGIKGRRSTISQKRFIKDYPVKLLKLEDNLRFFSKIIKNRIYYVSLGSLTNIHYFLENIPKLKNKTKFFIMGGTLNTDYQGRKRVIPEWNVAFDTKASQKVFSSGADITMIGLDATWNLELRKENIEKIRKSQEPLNKALSELYRYWNRYWKRYRRLRNPILYDPFTLAILIDESLVKFENYKISVDDKGRTIQNPNGQNVRVGIKSNKKKFLKLFMERILLNGDI